MNRNLFKVAASIVVFSLIQFSCGKDYYNSSDNPYNNKTTAGFNPNIIYGKMTDQDGNTYKTVKIGTQTWMAENLRTTKYNDGTPILNEIDIDYWEFLTKGAYCNYGNTNNVDTVATYGRLYNWHAIGSGKLAPKGWHVPTDAEWNSLTTTLGGESIAGGKLKETGYAHWSINLGATNESGFTALPGGFLYYYGTFYDFGLEACFWSATMYPGVVDTYQAIVWGVSYDGSSIGKGLWDTESGFYVRCVKD